MQPEDYGIVESEMQYYKSIFCLNKTILTDKCTIIIWIRKYLILLLFAFRKQ